MLAIELTFFTHNPADEELRTKYWQAYDDAAEKIIHGFDGQLSDLGWMMRWGASDESMQRAMQLGNGHFNYEHVAASLARNLCYVIFNLEHETILDENGFCLRKLGRS